ncbi:Uncharacterized protein (Fragment) [Durusdinium trenchii]|uniref:Uncharacterized protein n=1 Tax=Durusdinium trenchii TaxID=1381693 RepID=A0ABP0K7Q8_9DINO
MMAAPAKNISSWRLNAAETSELEARVAKGEEHAAVKRELQTKKAEACEARKRAAQAVSTSAAAGAPAGKRAKTGAAAAAAASPSPDQDATNATYYKEVQADIQRILAEFPGMEKEKPMQLTECAGTGVQEAFCREKGESALKTHKVYRASISVWWLNVFSSATPGVPMSRKRTLDMSEHFYPNGAPSFMTSQMVECQVTNADLAAEPNGLQMVSPEEIVHALLAGCARSIQKSPNWQSHKDKWRMVLLSIPCAFLLMQQSELRVAAFNRRQAVLQQHESLSRTGMQTVIEIAHLRSMLEAANPAAQKMNHSQVASELVKMGLKSVVSGRKADEDDAGTVSPNLVGNCQTISKSVLVSAKCVEILLQMEQDFGTRSPFHTVAALTAIAKKPTNAFFREWSMEAIQDAVNQKLLHVMDITKSSLQGDKHHCGLIPLYETKWKVLNHFWEELLPKSGMLSDDRALVKDIVYSKKYDNQIRQAARQGGSPESVLEFSDIAAGWDAVKGHLANEEAERKAAAKLERETAEVEEEENCVENLRKAPNNFPLNSTKYWRAVANQSMRTYITLQVEPKTQDMVASAVASSPLKDITSPIFTHLDPGLLGESWGPGQQARLRKKYLADDALLRKLLHGAMIGRGAQKKTPEGETTVPARGEIVIVHVGPDKSKQEVRAVFRLQSARKDAVLEAEEKELLIAYDDDSIRQRKKLTRGSYSLRSSLLFFSESPLIPDLMPEKQYETYNAWNTADLVGFVKALPPSALWHTNRTPH